MDPFKQRCAVAPSEGNAAHDDYSHLREEPRLASEESGNREPSHCGELSLDLLKSVSRSFYLSMVWLPRPMRRGIALGYLLARATDSVADSSDAPVGLRESVLELMGRSIASPTPPEEEQALLCELAETIAPTQQKAAEAQLLRVFGAALQALRTLPAEEALLLREVLSVIIEGQLWDLRFFNRCDSVTDDDETDHYTWLVAGCVGAFWTRLGRTTLGDAFCSAEEAPALEQMGISYGKGLQLINILRDRREDEARGRRYICSDPRAWMNRAERCLLDGLAYSRRLGMLRLRFTAALPALIGLRTLKRLRSSRDGERVRIPRRSVYASMLQAFLQSLKRRR